MNTIYVNGIKTKFKYSNGSRFLTHVAKRPHQDIEEENQKAHQSGTN